ncbi:hypothetical protein [Metallosphaera hakonensis]|uniref:hypothetical protein n=1 Tax=Metallosphaera hakonensis TaxID=79601 RepID=UPI000A6491F2|nr:hypothetical protein [Metallosphaera hakonensis]
MLGEKEIVLQAVEMVGKWDVMLAGIKGDELLIVSKKECPNQLTIEGMKLNVKRYDPDNYISLLYENENIFRDYRVFLLCKGLHEKNPGPSRLLRGL